MYVVRCMTHVYCMTRQFDPSLFVLVMEILETIVFMCESAHTNIRVGGKCRLALEYYCVPTRTWILLCTHFPPTRTWILLYPWLICVVCHMTHVYRTAYDSYFSIIVCHDSSMLRAMTHVCCVPHASYLNITVYPWLMYVVCHITHVYGMTLWGGYD